MTLSGRAVFGWLSQVVAWLVIIGVVAVLAVAVLIPRIAGATPYTVLTGSMTPTYPPGTLVVVKPIEFDEISIGDVVTYQLESGKSTVVTHRVVGLSTRFDGERLLVTQGDANQDPDAARVLAPQVRGKLWYSVPYLGHVNSAISGRQRQWAVFGVSALLVGYAAFMFVGSIRDRRRTKVAGHDEVIPGIDLEQQDSPTYGGASAGPVERQGSGRPPDRPPGVRAAVAVGGLVALGITYRLIKARRARATH